MFNKRNWLLLVGLALATAACAHTPTQPQAVTVNPTFAAYLGGNRAAANTHKVTFQNRTLYLHPKPIITAAEVKSVSRTYDDSIGMPIVGFKMKPIGAKKLKAATSTHIGDKLCLQVCGTIVNCATIQAPFGRRFMATGMSDHAYRAIVNQSADSP